MILLLLGVITGCKKNEITPDCEDETIQNIESQEFFPINTPYAWVQNVSEDESTVNLIINNQADYEKHIGISADTIRPAIDFNKYVLLAGRVIHPSCGSLKDQNVVNQCNSYVYNVNINNGMCGAFVKVNYFIIVDNSILPIKFNVHLQ